ncbi:MAG: 23S rRNA (guanosine(2251)-2'-O)-methyltransferase RlmB [Alphaproteobacteria bacterium]|nr:23S rRNA (guanosine(2251)-2'-O)-methyltransferase RlmB [Alphaproteobacteria bacterium]
MEEVIIYGKHAVLAALANPMRKIHKVFCSPENATEMRPVIGNRKLVVADRKEFEKLLPLEAVHQGVAATAEALKNVDIDDICAKTENKENCSLLILDQVTDPQNIGAIVRSCAAFGAEALVVQDKNSPKESGAMLKAAAGTYEKMPVCRVTNISRAVEKLKKAGFWVVGMDGYAKDEIASLQKGGKMAVIMGSEGKGMRRLVSQSCDMLVRLPISPDVESLNVSNAAAIVLYELSRK